MASIIVEQDLTMLLFATLFAFFVAFIPFLVNMLTRLAGSQSSDQMKKQKELSELQKQLNSMSMVDQFAKYAKIQRQINKITDELKSQSSSSNYLQIKIKLAATAILYIISFFSKLYILWTFGRKPVIILPATLFEPFYLLGLLVSFPTGIEGAVGMTPWIFVSYYVAKKVASSVLL